MSQGNNENFDEDQGSLSIEITSIQPQGEYTDCNLEFLRSHPAGDIQLDISIGETLYGKILRPESEKATLQSGTFQCNRSGAFTLASDRQYTFAIDMFVDGVLVARSESIAFETPKIVPLDVQEKYSFGDRTVYLYDDYSHCKYTRASGEQGIVVPEAQFQKIVGFKSGGQCNGSYNGTGIEPEDW